MKTVSSALYHYRQQFSTSLTLTAPWSIMALVAISVSLFALGEFYGEPDLQESVGSLFRTEGFVGARYALLLIAIVFGAVVMIAAPLFRLGLVRIQWITDTSSRLYQFKALKRTLGMGYFIFFACSVFVAQAAHASLVGIDWYDSAWRWTSEAVFSWPGIVSGFLAGLSFTFKYLRPSAEARFSQAFEPWTYGQLNLDVGAFGTESQEAARRLREYARARRDKASSSRAMRKYLLGGQTDDFSEIFRMRRILSDVHRLALKSLGTGSEPWRGLTRLRTRLGAMIGARAASSILLTGSTTNAIRLSLDLLARDVNTIVTTDLEHPAVRHMLSEVFGRRIRVHTVPLSACLWDPSAPSLDLLLEESSGAVAGQRAVWLFSHVDYATGGVLPIRKIVQKVRACMKEPIFVVDGAHGPGNTEVRVEDYGVDAYAFCGHKWLMGTPGSGFLWVSDKHQQRASKFDLEGPSLAESDASVFGRRSTLAMEPFLTCDAHLALLERVGIKEMLKHQHARRGQLAEAVGLIDGLDVVELTVPASSIVAFRPSSHVELTSANLIQECEDRYVLGGYFAERDVARFCVPYFLDEYSIRNIAAVLAEAVNKQQELAVVPN